MKPRRVGNGFERRIAASEQVSKLVEPEEMLGLLCRRQMREGARGEAAVEVIDQHDLPCRAAAILLFW